jgi:lysine-specific demethylase 3
MKHALKMPPPRYALAQPSSTESDATISQPPRCDSYDLHEAPRIHNDQVKVTSEEFQHHWSRGVPVVVTHVQLQGAWDPQFFVTDPEHKAVKVTLVDCETGKTRQSTVADFFGSFGKPEGRTKIEKVKVSFSPLPGISLAHGAGPLQQDWPPSEFLAEVLPQLCTDFAKSLPCPAMACLDGALNYASHFPHNAVGPDLGRFLFVHGAVRINNGLLDAGPKTYNALASVQDNYHSGSTRLHKDLTDAVNIMLWAAEFAKGVPGRALWHIFPAAASRIINEFLRRRGFTGLGDLIHLQQVYLTPALLNFLFEQTGVRPWTILQQPGDAVYIPAGCAHQVRLSFALSYKYE